MPRQPTPNTRPVDVVASPRRAEITLLRDAPVFRELDGSQLLALAAEAQRHTYMLGELIDMPAGEHLVTIVVSGGIRISLLSQQGRELTLSQHEVGSVFQFGGIEAALPGEALAQAICADTVLYFLPCQQFLRLVCINPPALTALAAMLRQAVEHDVQLIHALAFSSIRRRLAHLLAELAEPGEEPVVQRTRADLANLLGTRAEEVTKALHSLLAAGLVNFAPHGRTITLLAVDRLAAY